MPSTLVIHGGVQGVFYKNIDSPYGPTTAMLAKELRLRKHWMPSVLERDAESDFMPYLPSREMLAKESALKQAHL